MNVETSDASLDAAIKRLYSTFNRYKSHARTEGCPHCVSDEDIYRIHSKNLHDLSADDLAKYSFKAMTTWGSVDDFKRFLPRIFELVPTDTRFETEVVIGKLNYGRWQSWTKSEREAIRDFLACWWRFALRQPPRVFARVFCDSHMDRCLCSIGQAENDVGEYLQIWRDDKSLIAAIHLAEFVEREAQSLWKKRRLGNAFWDRRDQQMKQVVAWLCETASIEALEEAFFQAHDVAVAELISHSVEELRQLRGIVAHDENAKE